MGKLDVAKELNTRAILCDGLKQRGVAQHASVDGESLLLNGVFRERARVWSNDDNASVAIDDDHVAVSDAPHDSTASDDARDFNGTRDDRGVARASTEIGSDPNHERAIHPCGLRGSQFMRDDDRRFR